MNHRRSSLTPLDRTELRRLDVDLPAVVEATAPLVRARSGKWHAPVKDGKSWGHCQHAVKLSAAAPEQVVVLDALADLCSHCANTVEVSDGVRALWQALFEILTADGRAAALAGSRHPRTWPTYAKALEEAARHDDSLVRSLLKPVLDHDELSGQAWQALKAWTAVVERSEHALAAYRASAPSAVATASVTAACDAVAADRAVHEESRALSAAVGGGFGYGWRSAELWATVRSAWIMAREQGSDAGGALDFVTAVVAREWGTARVRDVSALPLPALTCAAGHSSPAAWADHEFHQQWHAYVQRWCARLEAALTSAAQGSEDQQLLLVCGWPLTTPDDRDLAFLAQYDQIGPRVPCGGSGQHYDPYEDRSRVRSAVVLSVPQFAAERALAHATAQRGRMKAGPTLPEAGPEASTDGLDAGVLAQAYALLRTAYPLLAEDVDADGNRPRPSEAVRKARGILRGLRGSEPPVHWAPQRREDSRWRWKQTFEEGAWVWVPDDSAGGPSWQQLVELTEPYPPHGDMRLVVETGPRGDAELHTLYGTISGWDRRRRQLSFTVLNTDHHLTVPAHRIVGLTSVRYRRGRHEPPLWEDFTPPGPHQYYW